MKNKSPIILNCFSRGGSNILWNLFLSHPMVLHPIEETLQIFNTRFLDPRIEGFKIIWMERRRVFKQWDFKEIEPVKVITANYIDNVLYDKKVSNLKDSEMSYKTSSLQYTQNEVKNTRLVIKNNNGLIYCTKMFSKIYPDANFIALTRHPLALYESHKRRNTPVSKSIKDFVDYYRKIANKMISDRARLNNYHIIKFEKLLSEPIDSIKKLYYWTQLDFSMIEQIRLKAKPFMKIDGSHSTQYTRNKHYWFDFNKINEILEPRVNDFQSFQLSNKERESLLTLTEKIRNELGYDV